MKLFSLQRRWLRLLSVVRQERFPSFLRYHLLCQEGGISKQRLFKLVRDRVKSAAEVFELLDVLERRAELFAALADSSHECWVELPAAKVHIKELVLFRVQQPTPLLFACWEKFSRPDFVKVLRLVSVLSFRYSVIGGLNPNKLDESYHQAAKAVLDGLATTPSAIHDKLEAIQVSDDKFRRDFADQTFATSGSGRKLTKYILSKLEAERSGHAVDPETDPASVEHILPQNPATDWIAAIPEADWPAHIDRLGNLTLLEAPLNRQLANATYTDKLRAYQGSRYQLTKDLLDTAPEEWTVALIEARQLTLAARAAHIWRA